MRRKFIFAIVVYIFSTSVGAGEFSLPLIGGGMACRELVI